MNWHIEPPRRPGFISAIVDDTGQVIAHVERGPREAGNEVQIEALFLLASAPKLVEALLKMTTLLRQIDENRDKAGEILSQGAATLAITASQAAIAEAAVMPPPDAHLGCHKAY